MQVCRFCDKLKPKSITCDSCPRVYCGKKCKNLDFKNHQKSCHRDYVATDIKKEMVDGRPLIDYIFESGLVYKALEECDRLKENNKAEDHKIEILKDATPWCATLEVDIDDLVKGETLDLDNVSFGGFAEGGSGFKNILNRRNILVNFILKDIIVSEYIFSIKN